MSVRIAALHRFLPLQACFRGSAFEYARMSSRVGSPLSAMALLDKGVTTYAEVGPSPCSGGVLAIADPFFILHWFCLVFLHTWFQSHQLHVVYLTLCFPSCPCRRLFYCM